MSSIAVHTYSAVYQDQITQLILNIQTEEFGIPISINDQPDLLDVPSFYQKGVGNFWVALDGCQVVGTIALVDIGDSQTALRKMFVKKEYRGRERGVAKALLNTLIQYCKQMHVHEIYLGTTSAYLAAHRFYEKNGFQEVLKETLPKAFPLMRVDSKFYVYRF